MANGWPAGEVFSSVAASGYTYDDIIFMPGHVSFEASAVDVTGQLTRNIMLRTPLVGGPADTVTESGMAIALALLGGVGIIHDNQSVKAQVDMVKKVKRYVSGFILEPATLSPDHTLADMDMIKAERGVSGIPITDNGQVRGKLVGFVSSRDVDTVEDRSEKLSSVMVQKVVTARDPLTLGEAREQLKRSKVGKLPITDDEQRLISMVTRTDITKAREFPLMSTDLNGHLLVGAAVAAGVQDDWERAAALAEAGADVLCVGAASSGDKLEDLLWRLKAEYPKLELIAGPVATCREAKRLVEAGADAILAGSERGIGEDALGTVAMVGRAEATAVFELSRYLRQHYRLPVIAGSGIRSAGQVLKALCLGASSVMLGDLLSGADEAPGEYFVQGAGSVKLTSCTEPMLAMPHTPGSASNSAGFMHGPPKALPCRVGSTTASKGSVKTLVPYFAQGLRYGMQDVGAKSIAELHAALESGDLLMECRSRYAKQSWEARGQALQHAAHPEVMPVFVSS